jgi:hypothetical protein
MTIRTTHELHHRRFGRNLALGLALTALVTFGFGYTMFKVARGDFVFVPEQEQDN